jgi:hypothetical protein
VIIHCKLAGKHLPVIAEISLLAGTGGKNSEPPLYPAKDLNMAPIHPASFGPLPKLSPVESARLEKRANRCRAGFSHCQVRLTLCLHQPL